MKRLIILLQTFIQRSQLIISQFCLCCGFTAQSTQWGHVERGQFTQQHFYWPVIVLLADNQYFAHSFWELQKCAMLLRDLILHSRVKPFNPEDQSKYMCLSRISGRERITVEKKIMINFSTKDCCRPGMSRTHNLLITSRTRIQLSLRGRILN